MSNEENKKINSEITDKGNKEVTNNDNSLKYEIFKDNIFSEEGFNNYIKNVEKVENVKNNIKSIIDKDNANPDNLDLIRESRIISESKQKYNAINGLFFFFFLALYTVVLELARSQCDKLIAYLFLIIFGIITAFIYFYMIYCNYKKLEEKRAAAYFWLETEIEKRITESK